ncbi:MAG TPA: hypothetical protein VHK24_04800 [Steroidobacter sp.]|jgi:transposase|nr:hypothetical protein [Steroidobacter sp.]
MYSTKGRPRRVTDAQVTAILEWHRTHKNLNQLARELGLPVSTVGEVIRRQGHYKQPSPELRHLYAAARRDRLKRLADSGWL